MKIGNVECRRNISNITTLKMMYIFYFRYFYSITILDQTLKKQLLYAVDKFNNYYI